VLVMYSKIRQQDTRGLDNDMKSAKIVHVPAIYAATAKTLSPYLREFLPMAGLIPGTFCSGWFRDQMQGNDCQMGKASELSGVKQQPEFTGCRPSVFTLHILNAKIHRVLRR
jgi:hypothetical protein